METSLQQNRNLDLVLGIETSCDETGIALYHGERGLLANLLHSQAELHADYGGVVPELASRDHIRKIAPLVQTALDQAEARLDDLQGIAYTAGPGLMGALLVGAAFGRALALSLNIPALAVHHMEAHLLAPLIDAEPPPLPFVALLVSGGHTLLVRVDGIGAYETLGESLDDAAGEAFDKVAKLLGLGYPGGPRLAACAEPGDRNRFSLPRPMTDKPGLDFSFSGLKTATARVISAGDATSHAFKADVAASFQEAVVETLAIKCRRALEACATPHLVIAGGVAANVRLRDYLAAMPEAVLHYPPLPLCTDNGAMIAYAGWRRLAAGQSEPLAIHTRPRWPLSELPRRLGRV